MPFGAAKLAFALTCGLLGCRCGSLEGEFEGQRYTRCAQVDAPPSGSAQVGALKLHVEGRVLRIEAPLPLRIAAFSGPVGGTLEARDLALIRQARPGLLLYLGGLGDSAESARDNLVRLAALRIPTLFVAGGEDRWPVVEAAFSVLSDSERVQLLNATGLREVRLGSDRFVVVPGAPFGRYALDEHSCGLGSEDIEAIQAAAREGEPAARTWLLGWHAPAGFGISEGSGGSELGSPDLQALAIALAAQGGLFAFPEVQAGRAPAGSLARVVPRLGGLGSQRADGSRLSAGVTSLLLDGTGLKPLP